MKKLTPLNTTYRYRAIQDALRDYIIENRLQPGDRLPSEMDLAEQMGVSRNPIREAVKGLEALGLVEVRVGLGVFVKEASLDDLLSNFAYELLFDNQSVAELYEIRQRLELSYAREAVQSLTPDALDEMDQLLQEMENKHRDAQDYHLPDLALHRRLFEGVGNATLLKIFDIFGQIYTHAHHLFDAEPPTVKEDDIQRHRDLLDALRQRNPDLVIERLKLSYTALPDFSPQTTPDDLTGIESSR